MPAPHFAVEPRRILTSPEFILSKSFCFSSEEQIDIFHKILDCVSETAAAEMRVACRIDFKDGVELMKEIQE